MVFMDQRGSRYQERVWLSGRESCPENLQTQTACRRTSPCWRDLLSSGLECLDRSRFSLRLSSGDVLLFNLFLRRSLLSEPWTHCLCAGCCFAGDCCCSSTTTQQFITMTTTMPCPDTIVHPAGQPTAFIFGGLPKPQDPPTMQMKGQDPESRLKG